MASILGSLRNTVIAGVILTLVVIYLAPMIAG